MAQTSAKGPSFNFKSGVTTTLNHLVPILHVRIGIDPALAESEDDTFTLSSSDGKYKKTLTIKDDKVDGDEFVDLVFENLKTSGTYTLEVNPGKEGSPYKVFEDVPFQDLIDYYSMLEPGDDLEEAEEEESQTEQKGGGEGDDDWENDGGGDSPYGGDPDDDSSEMDSIVEGENEEEGEEINWDAVEPASTTQSVEDEDEEVSPYAEW